MSEDVHIRMCIKANTRSPGYQERASEELRKLQSPWRDWWVNLLFMYLGAGLSLALVMATVVPLSTFGIAVYTWTWPRHVYCAQVEPACFSEADYLPTWMLGWMFDLEKPHD